MIMISERFTLILIVILTSRISDVLYSYAWKLHAAHKGVRVVDGKTEWTMS